MTNLLKLFSLETLDELDHLGVAMDVKYVDQLLPAWLICGLVFNQFPNMTSSYPISYMTKFSVEQCSK